MTAVTGGAARRPGSALRPLLRAESRKIVSTRLWWALLLPATLFAAFTNLIGGGISRLDEAAMDNGAALPFALVTLGVTAGGGTIFAMLHGMLATTGEMRHRTLTTSYLTTRSRGELLVAKLAAHAVGGFIFGAVTCGVGLLAALAGAGVSGFPEATVMIETALIGVLASVVWAMIGVGVGMVIGNQVAAILSVLVWSLLGEGVLAGFLEAADAGTASAALPVTASGRMVMAVPGQEFVDTVSGHLVRDPDLNDSAQDLVDAMDTGTAWWTGALTLCCWLLATSGLAWWVGRHRDIT